MDELEEYYNIINTENNIYFYINSENQSENDNKSELIKSNNFEQTILNKIDKENKNELNYNNFNLFEDNKNNIFGEDDFYINEKNNIEQNNKVINEKTNLKTITLNKGRVINSINATISNVMNDLFQNDKINIETKKDMQLIKTKKRRRTKKEIDLEKSKKSDEKKEKKNRGRMKKNEINNLNCRHSKKADDNIIKKMNTFFINSVKKWLNNSFIDENGNFLKNNKKFLKVCSLTISNNLKKSEITKLMKMTIKEIFSNEISIKYKIIQKDYNKNLIEEIFKENKQHFVKSILDLTFIVAFNIFNGQITINEFKKLFQGKNLDENKYDEFYNNFEKIDCFLKKIYFQEKEKVKETETSIKDYIERIGLLSVNYEKWFERKFNRNANKAKIK